MNPNRLPPDVSLDFAMTEDNLFAVWYKATPFMKKLGEADVFIEWMLADTEDTIENLESHSAQGAVLAAVSLAEINKLMGFLKQQQTIFSLFKPVYFVEVDGVQKWSNKKEGTVLLEGRFRDLEKLQSEGQEIFDKKNYHKIFGDDRKIEPGHPDDWIYFMRNPENAAELRETLNRVD